MARKLNKALVAAVASVAILGGGAYVAAPKILQMMRPVGKMIEAGDAAVAGGDWKLAATNYGKAASRAGNDVELQLKYVDALDHTVDGDVEKLRQVRQVQAQILANDPRSVPALRQVLAYQRSDVQRFPGDTAAVRSLAGTAERLEKLVPGDREARLATATSVFEPYTRNLEVRPEDLDAQRAAVDKLVEEKPDDAEALRLATQFRTYPVQRALQQGDTADVKEKLTQAMAYIDAAVERTPQSAGAWVLRADTYRLAAFVLPGNDAALREQLARKYLDSLQKADELVKPGDPLLLAIRLTVLRELERRDPKQAEARYRKLLEELPDDRQARLALAEFLARQPSRRDEAVALLETPFTPTKVLRGMESVDQRTYGLVELVRRASFRLGALMNATAADDRKKRIDAIEQDYRTMRSDPDISTRFKPALLRVQGGLELAQGKVTEAITTLDAAIKLIDPASPSSVDQDTRNDTLMEYAQAQLRLNQGGQARPALAELVQRKPENLAARAMLADLLIRERNLTEADQQVQVLEKMAGDAPVVQKMRLQILLAQGSLKERYPQLAETSREQRFLKLQVAGSLNDNAEVARLAGLILAGDPGDRDAAVAAVQALLAQDRRDEAVRTVAAALKAKPDNAEFKAVAENLAAVTPEDRQRLMARRVENLTDPFVKALNQGELARTQGRPADAIESYKQAQKLEPGDARAFEAQFQLAVALRRFADAEGVLADLARLNVDQAGGALRRVQLAAARAVVESDPARRETLFKDATAQAQTAAQQNGQLSAASLLYAQVLQQTGDVAAAIDQYQQTLDKAPTNVDALTGIVNCLLQTDRRGEARDRLSAVKALAPDDARVRELELAYDMRFGDPLKAVDTLTQQQQQTPDNPQTAVRLGAALEQVAATRTGDDAKPFLTRAAELYEKSFARFPQDLRFLAYYTEVERRLGQPRAAEEAVEKAAADPLYQDKPDAAQLLADQYVRSGKIDDAARVLGGVIERTRPAPADSVQRLALILAGQKRLPEALKVLDVRGDDAGVQRQRVTLLLDAGDLPAARQAAETALAAHGDPETYLLAAFVELRTGDFDRCEGFVNKVLAVRPNDAAALFYRAQVRLNRPPADFDGAREDLVKARDASPRSTDVRLALAELHTRRGDREAALTELQQAWAADRSAKRVLLQLVDAYARSTPPAWTAVTNLFADAKASPRLATDPDVLLAEADTWAQRNDPAKAVAAAKAALAVAPTNPPLQQRYYDVLMRAKAYRDVVAETGDALRAAPDAWWLYRMRGLAQRQLNQPAEAQKALDAAFNLAAATNDANVIGLVARSYAEVFDAKTAAAKLDPMGDPSLRVMSAELTHDAGDLNGSIAKLETLLADRAALGPALTRRALQSLGLCYMESVPVKAKPARAVFEELLKQTPDDVSLLNNLACMLLLPDSGGTPADALKPAQHAAEIVATMDAPNLVPLIQDTHGWALVKNNRVPEGLELLRRSAEASTFPDVAVHLAEAYLLSGDLSAAEAALVDARSRIESAKRQRQPIDATLPDRVTQLSDDLAKKKAAAG